MNVTVSIVVVAAELVVSALSAFISIAALGFAGEATRSKDLTAFGWILGALYIIVALTPLVATTWVAYRRFVSDKAFPVLEIVSSPYLVPVVLLVGAAIFCVGLLAFQNGAGLAPR
ncbi:hypothetical protein CO683_01860 [Bradyrhizobium ottawaense]|uniref:hypothetical protein n=1 Tax=Bradyrhizobium ottawaense TaxID=931866 RepID=UPI000BE8AD33|nr:hypothetical protein [Bradyrhizobium ottawaense]PDT71918.1 hypothetical protein CO683_01860 [Bradyrhizobium ottawaense]